MQQARRRSSLVPRGFAVESAYYRGDKATIEVRPSGAGAKSLLSASLKGCWLHRPDARRGWTLSYITSFWRLAGDRRLASQKG
jgi:hypothetical protein